MNSADSRNNNLPLVAQLDELNKKIDVHQKMIAELQQAKRKTLQLECKQLAENIRASLNAVSSNDEEQRNHLPLPSLSSATTTAPALPILHRVPNHSLHPIPPLPTTGSTPGLRPTIAVNFPLSPIPSHSGENSISLASSSPMLSPLTPNQVSPAQDNPQATPPFPLSLPMPPLVKPNLFFFPPPPVTTPQNINTMSSGFSSAPPMPNPFQLYPHFAVPQNHHINVLQQTIMRNLNHYDQGNRM